MASKSFLRGLQTLRVAVGNSKDPLIQCLAPRWSRSMATEAPLPSSIMRNTEQGFISTTESSVPSYKIPDVLTTIYKFPSMEPLRFEAYPANHLHLPLRRDILHRAVIFEGDATRQGTASTKTRWEIHGSHRKIRPQKGSGRARLGTRQSPMLKGGGKSFGPHPRDFSTGLQRKVYDLAWRTALSYRYRKGELIVCEDGMELPSGKVTYFEEVFAHNRWGNADGRSLVITLNKRTNLFQSLSNRGGDGKALIEREVDVKNLLEMGRIIIEKSALDNILRDHQSDLAKRVASAAK